MKLCANASHEHFGIALNFQCWFCTPWQKCKMTPLMYSICTLCITCTSIRQVNMIMNIKIKLFTVYTHIMNSNIMHWKLLFKITTFYSAYDCVYYLVCISYCGYELSSSYFLKKKLENCTICKLRFTISTSEERIRKRKKK